MQRSVLFFLGFSAAAAACGGESVRTRNDESGGRATGGTSTTGGSTTGGTLATGGVSTTGGASGAAGTSSGAAGTFGRCADGSEPPSVTCVYNCYAEQSEPAFIECRDGFWQCPPASEPLSGCPANACANKGAYVCCFHKNGNRSAELCDAGLLAGCLPIHERIEAGGECLPEGVEATTCWELQGLPCSDPESGCSGGSGCGTHGCECTPNPEGGGYTWQCSGVLC